MITATPGPDLLHHMTSARRAHDRALGEFFHTLWTSLLEELTPAPVLHLRQPHFRHPHPLHPAG